MCHCKVQLAKSLWTRQSPPPCLQCAHCCLSAPAMPPAAYMDREVGPFPTLHPPHNPVSAQPMGRVLASPELAGAKKLGRDISQTCPALVPRGSAAVQGHQGLNVQVPTGFQHVPQHPQPEEGRFGIVWDAVRGGDWPCILGARLWSSN